MRLLIGIEGLTLSAADKKRLQHKAVAGVILFTRNYQDLAQLKNLTLEIRNLNPELLISVDHEGGRVQRFREGFTRIPSAKKILECYKKNPSLGLNIAEACGYVYAVELQQYHVDLSYAPVLDLDFGISAVIGDRSFGSLTQDAIALTAALMRGMQHGGMANVGKHFPGHGGVEADSHGEIAIDHRSLDYLWHADILPYRHLIPQGLTAIMPAHVIYPKVDDKPAGFSKIWLQDILRQQLGFNGAIISDDLDMSGSDAVGDLSQKLILANAAGCDFALICNRFDAMDQALTLEDSYLGNKHYPINKLFGKYRDTMPESMLAALTGYRAKIQKIIL